MCYPDGHYIKKISNTNRHLPCRLDLVTCSWYLNLPDWHSNSRANQTMVESLQTCSYH